VLAGAVVLFVGRPALFDVGRALGDRRDGGEYEESADTSL
jgi:hypothetical protein